jgi:hypothetical protein
VGRFGDDKPPKRSGRRWISSAAQEAAHRLRLVRYERLPATLQPPWSTQRRQSFGAIANDDANGSRVCQVHCNISASTCGRRSNDTVDTFRNPNLQPIPARQNNPGQPKQRRTTVNHRPTTGKTESRRRRKPRQLRRWLTKRLLVRILFGEPNEFLLRVLRASC